MTATATRDRSGNRVPVIVCTGCGHERPHEAKGLCQKCYDAAKYQARKERETDPPPCRHCQKFPAHRPRGLCWSCYLTPGLRDLYRSTSKYAIQGNGLLASTVLPEPTGFLPGTPEKMGVMQERVAAGQLLFHPLDARGE
jgi:hypothetical protein